MKVRCLFSLVCFCLSLLAEAVSFTPGQMTDTLKIAYSSPSDGMVEGEVTNEEGAPLGGVIVRILSLPDSTVRGGAATDTLGRYSVGPLPEGRYCVKCDAMGYSKAVCPLVLDAAHPSVTLKPFRLVLNDQKLGEAIIVGTAPLVTVTEDTVAYNASAMTTTEGAMADELIEQIPGAEITEEGKIKINGKEYSKILIDGKEYFGNDPSATLNNLPANIIRRIKTYDRRSDKARLTGIDDGEEHNVIDIEIKRNMFKGMVGNVGISAGNKDRYAGRANVNRFRSNQHAGLVVNMNNVNNPAFSERGNGASNASRNARTGYTAAKSLGFTFAKDKRKAYKVSGNVRYNYSNGVNESDRYTETKYTNLTENYNNNHSGSVRRRHELNAELEWEWHPDTLTTIQMRPNLSYNSTDNGSSSRGVVTRWNGKPTGDTVNINNTNSLNLSENNGLATSASMLLFRRLSPEGRNMSFSGSFSYNDNNSHSAIRNFATYHLQPLRNRNYDRYYNGGNYSLRYSLGFNYTEPVFEKTYLQFRYGFTSQHSRTNRYGYEYWHDSTEMDLVISDTVGVHLPIDSTLSNITANQYTSHVFNLSMRHVTDKLNLSYGVQLNPRHNESNFILGQKMDRGLVKQDLINWAPHLRFKYKFTKRNSMEIVYNGNSSEPNVEQLQELIDKTNPQFIRYGNPNLKPAFHHNVRANLNLYGEKSHRSLVTNWGYSVSNNTTSNMTFSESATGFRISKLMNVNGQWSANGNVNFNMPLDSMQRWNISTVTSGNFSNNTNYNSTPLSNKQLNKYGIGSLQDILYEDIDKLKDLARINHTHAFRLNQGIDLRFRHKVFSWRLGGRVSYYKVSNSVKNGLKRETFDYTATAHVQTELPFNGQLSTNVNYVSRHGYSSSIQKNVCIWNAQLTKRLFARDAGLLSFQIFDILHQRSNVTRTINNISISDTRQLMLQDYFLVSFQYNFNTLRNKGRGRGFNRNGNRQGNFNNMRRTGYGGFNRSRI